MKAQVKMMDDAYEACAQQAIELSGTKSTDDLYKQLGDLAQTADLRTNALSSRDMAFHKNFLSAQNIDNANAKNLTASFPAMSFEQSKTFGLNFFQNFKDRIHDFICTNDTISKWFSSGSDANRKTFVKNAIALILPAIGVAISQIVISIVVVVVAILLKIGYQAYCGVNNNEN